MSANTLLKQKLSWIVMSVAGVLVALASLAFDALRFDLVESGDFLSSLLWILLSFADGSFAYVLLVLCAGISSQRPLEATFKSGLSLFCALGTYYVLSIGLGIRPAEETGRLLFQAIFWCIAAALLCLIVAPLAYKMTDKSYPFNQAAAGVVLSLLAAPYCFTLVTRYSDGIYFVSTLLCAATPLVMIVYRLRYKQYMQLFISVILTSVVCIAGLLAIYRLGY